MQNEPDTRSIHLFVVMTTGTSLRLWQDKGMLARELALYQRLRPSLGGITIISHGGPEDLAIISAFQGIDLVVNRHRLPERVYRWLLPALARKKARGATAIYKSNQIRGADIAHRLAMVNSGTFIARCGYLLSEFEAESHGVNSENHLAAEGLEREAFGTAARSIVTTEAMRQKVLTYGVHQGLVSVVPNYVDTDLFSPSSSTKRNPKRILFVGRLSPQKNPMSLVAALAGTTAELHVVGEGPLSTQMEQLAQEKGVSIRFYGAVSNPDLPKLINESAIFVLPSNYEGHPKTLLEAMSCGIAVIGGDSPGIAGVIDHNRTGLLSRTDSESLRNAIVRLLEDRDLADKLGTSARAEMISTVSLDRVAKKELAVYKDALSENSPLPHAKIPQSA